MTPHSPTSLRLALPDDEALPMLCEHLRASGFAIPPLQGPGLHRVVDPLGLGVNFDVCKIAPGDVGAYVEHGITKLGVMRTDLLSESGAEVWRPFTFSYGSAPLVLAAPRGLTLEHLTSRPYIRLATSLPNRTRDIFAARGLAIEVVPVADSPTACLFGLADGYVDRLTDPQRLIQEGFRVLELLEHTHLKLIINRACYAARSETILELIHRLHATQPEPPPPVIIPFDDDEDDAY